MALATAPPTPRSISSKMTALLCQRDLEREDEAAEFPAAGDLGERREIGAGVGRDLELDRIHAMRPPAIIRKARDAGQEASGIQLERSKFRGHRRIEPQRSGLPRSMHGFGRLAVARGGGFGLAFQDVELRLSALDRSERRAKLAHLVRQAVDLAAMLAGQGAQVEQSGFGDLERLRVEIERLGGGGELFLRLASLDDRSVERRQGLGQQRMLWGNAIEPPGRHPEGRQR
jgi:hypothetical protein